MQVLDDALGVRESSRLRAHQQLGDAIHDPQVAVHARLDVRALDLHHGLSTVEEDAGVDLGDRRRRQRRVVEGPEDLANGPAQVLANDSAGGLGRKRWYFVEEAQTGVGQWAGEQSGRRGDQLAELDERGTQELEGPHQALGQFGGP